MRIISFINKKRPDVIEKILENCNLSNDKMPRPPPKGAIPSKPEFEEEIQYKYTFFDSIFT